MYAERLLPAYLYSVTLLTSQRCSQF